MQIIATFEYSAFLEIAISELEAHGMTSIYAVPLEQRRKEPRLMDSIHRADGLSFIDKGFIFAFMFATVGASKGYVWAWGPVICGLLGAAAGFAFGALISWVIYLFSKQKKTRWLRGGKKGEVVLVVQCRDELTSLAEDILWDHKALGLAVTK